MSDDWLRPAAFACGHCETRLFRVDHSPMLDSDRLYCDRCPRFADVSWYDPTYTAIAARVPTGRVDHLAFMAALEPELEPCACGGQFRFAAARRCYRCGHVAVDEVGVDLFPYSPSCDDPDREPTDEEQAEYDAFERDFGGRARWRSTP